MYRVSIEKLRERLAAWEREKRNGGKCADIASGAIRELRAEIRRREADEKARKGK